MCSPPEAYVQALYDFSYETEDGKKVWMREGEEYLLLKKTNGDWWQVIRDGDKRPFYAPASYVEEISQPGLLGKPHKKLPSVASTNSVPDLKNNGAVHVTLYSNDLPALPAIVPKSRSAILKLDAKDGHSSKQRHDAKKASGPAIPQNSVSRPLPQKPAPNKTVVAPPPPVQLHSQIIVSNPIYALEHTTLLGKANFKKDISVSEQAKDIATKNEKEKDNRLITEEQDKNRRNKQLLQTPSKDKKAEVPALAKPLQPRPPSPIYANFPLISSPTPPSPQLTEFPLRILDGDWAEFEDCQGRKYYFNYVSKEKSWKPPRRRSENSKPSSTSSSKESSPHPESENDDKDRSLEANLHRPTPDSLVLPPGWSRKYDPDIGEICYVNDLTKEKWLTSTDDLGRIYYYQENAAESFWQLPEVVFAETDSNSKNHRISTRLATSSVSLTNGRSPTLNTSGSPPKSLSPRRRPLSMTDRGSKTRSMIITDTRLTYTNDFKDARSSTLPKSLTSHSIVDFSKVSMHGLLSKTKLSDGGKKMRKNWSIFYVILTDSSLFFFKDLKNLKEASSNKAEFSADLVGAQIEWTPDKSSRKNVFQITTRSDVQLLLQEEDAQIAKKWFDEISRAIQQLPSMWRYPPVIPSGSSSEDSKQSLKVGRSRSVKRIDMKGSGSSSTEDLDCSQIEKKLRIRDKLKNFFSRRPTMESLQEKGIIKEEPVFGSTLQSLYAKDKCLVPKFVQACIAAIEKKDMSADGLYRASGNLSQVQKIRFKVNQDNLEILNIEEDIHVLTGSLKMFFRELKEPLFPFNTFSRFLEAIALTDRAAKLQQFRSLILSLPKPNFHTLKTLLQHLLRVTELSNQNRMHIQNLAIVFGPTLMWSATTPVDIALDVIHQNQIIEFLLMEFSTIFR